ncbi:hypothetical protein BY996DRAFT_6409967 [Phakopsora pachyrhizi]|nr:hypothetical protein BY996DRAFT_6409967 [Phakopsora pachyrhizi]
MSAHSAATTNSIVYLPTNCSATLKVLKCSESAVGFQAVCMCCKGYLDLKDEIDHAVDDPQNIANSVYSASQRANKLFGIETPTYYANLVATRAKKHFRIQDSIPGNDENDDKLNSKDGDGGD